jgi:hypothetical protein
MRTWIFQSNPDRFNIDSYLAARPAEFLWLVTRYDSDVSIGDRVYLWRNQGASGPTIHVSIGPWPVISVDLSSTSPSPTRPPSVGSQ